MELVGGDDLAVVGVVAVHPVDQQLHRGGGDLGAARVDRGQRRRAVAGLVDVAGGEVAGAVVVVAAGAGGAATPVAPP